MSLSRRVTSVVILTIVLSSFSTVFVVSEVDATEKSDISPVIQGPVAIEFPAIAVSHPNPISRHLAFGEVKSATAKIVTKAKVLDYFHDERTAANGQIVINFAMSQIGDPYVWGGNGPNGWDCSGLMVGSFHQIGVNLPRTSRAQYGVGTPVEYGQWQPGDLLFFGSSAGSIHHVVLYVGNGQIVHASTFGVPVKVDSVAGGGRDYFGARRIV
jgi:cell wall-associated NlpC family hydrolase